MYNQNNGQDRVSDRYAWFEAVARTTEPIFANAGNMAIKDNAQRQVSEEVVKTMILMNIAQALGIMDYDIFADKLEFDRQDPETKAKVLKRNKFFIYNDWKAKPIFFLYNKQAIVQRDAGIGLTYQQESHSIITQFMDWKKAQYKK